MNMNNATASINCNDLINLQAGGKRKALKKKSLKKRSVQKGGKKGKRSGGKRRSGNSVTTREQAVRSHPPARTVGLFGVGISADELIDEYKNYPLDSFVSNIFSELRVADPTDKYSYNTKILSLINSMLDKGRTQFQRDQYFIDLRQNFANIALPKQGGDQYRDVDTADLLNVLRDVVRMYIQKARPTIKVESASRKVASAIKDFKQTQEQSCPPLNEPHKTQRFIDPDGHFGCRVPMEPRNLLEAVDAGAPAQCPPFKGSRRTQFHVTADGKGICREPVRTGEHACPAPGGDPLATIHETLPGGVGICKKPFEVPQTLVVGDGNGVLPTSVINPPYGFISASMSGGRKSRAKKLSRKKVSKKLSKKSQTGGKKKRSGKKKSSRKKSKGKRKSKKSKKGRK